MTTDKKTIHNTQPSAPAPEKSAPSVQTSFELRHDKRSLSECLDRILELSHGEITEDNEAQIDALIDQITHLDGRIEAKIRNLRIVKERLEVEAAGFEGRKKQYDKMKKREYKSQKARERNIDRVKDLVVLNLESLDEKAVRIDGKKVYIREFASVQITDEAKAYAGLAPAGLAERRFILSEDDHQQLNSLLGDLHEAGFDADSHQPVAAILTPALATRLLAAMDLLAGLTPDYSFAPASQLNAHAAELSKVRAEKLCGIYSEISVLNDQIEGAGPDHDTDQLRERLAGAHEDARRIETQYAMPGTEVHVKKTPFGL